MTINNKAYLYDQTAHISFSNQTDSNGSRKQFFLPYFPEMKNPRIESANNDEIDHLGIMTILA